MIFQKKIGLFIAILFLPPLWAEAQEHHFTNPQVRVQLTGETLNVTTTGYPDHKWEKVNPNIKSWTRFVQRTSGSVWSLSLYTGVRAQRCTQPTFACDRLCF